MNTPAHATEILEVTLRDGSYLVDFQFTAEDTALVTSALDSAGFRWIEIGHGLGLNASAMGKGVAAATDEEYMQAAADAVQQARWGMFFIPGIGRAEDLHLAARYGMGFLRVGANAADVEKTRPFIELAKELGMIVSYNAMKSYAVSPQEFGRCCELTSKWGADIVCLVDSAGGMYPEDVANYLKAAKDSCSARLGFHGHDNLALAMANTIQAIESGATLVDSSLQGIGRSAGNTITEVLVAVMNHRGLLPEMNLKTVTDIGQALIQPTLRRRGMDPMAVIGGAARFHSSFTPKLQAYADKYALDIRDLVVRLCEINQNDAPDDLLESLSKEIAADRMPRMVAIRGLSRNAAKQNAGGTALDAVLKEIRALAVKSGKFSCLNIVVSEQPCDDFRVSANIHDSQTHVIGSVALSSSEQLTSVLKQADGRVDILFLDSDRKAEELHNTASIAQQNVQTSTLLTYSDRRVWVSAVETQVIRLLNERLASSEIVIIGDHPNARRLAVLLAEQGSHVVSLAEELIDDDLANSNVVFLKRNSEPGSQLLSQTKVVVLWTKNEPAFSLAEMTNLRPESWIIDAGIGSLSPNVIEKAYQNGYKPVRVNIWPALSAALSAAHESARICATSLGWAELANIPIVAGGAIGRSGDVIVDSVSEPTRVIGIADGNGGVCFDYGDADAERVRVVFNAIHQRLIISPSKSVRGESS